MSHEITKDYARSLLLGRPADGHKGTFGHLFVVAGSRGFTGAAKLACRAAARSGVGLVTLGMPAPLGDIFAASLTETMTFLLASTEQETVARDAIEPALEFASTKDAVIIGPGLSQNESTREFVRSFVRHCTPPLLVDADGLNCLSSDPDVLDRRNGPCVITPHPREMSRISGIGTKEFADAENRELVARDIAARFGCTVVLKGHRTVVAGESGEYWVNTTGNSGLASAGTGDVLSGLIGGLLAQGMNGVSASVLGVYLHGLSADLAAEAKTERGMIASDVIDFLPDAWRELEEAETE